MIRILHRELRETQIKVVLETPHGGSYVGAWYLFEHGNGYHTEPVDLTFILIA